jgi:predicted nucleotidyltransferase
VLAYELVDSTATTLTRLRQFASAVRPDVPPVGSALDATRRLLLDAGVDYKLVGGVAVVHHGYERTTEDIDVLVEAGGPAKLGNLLTSHDFERVSPSRLRHVPSGVVVDLLVAGSPLPRAGAGAYPAPESLAASPNDATIVGLAGLVDLKLRARRHRDLADVVELLKRLDEVRYVEIEAGADRELRPLLASLRRDAIEELAAG